MKWIDLGFGKRCLLVGNNLVRMIIFNGQGYNIYDISGYRTELLIPLVKTWEEAMLSAEQSLG